MYINDALRRHRTARALTVKSRRDLVRQGLIHAYDLRRTAEERRRAEQQSKERLHLMLGHEPQIMSLDDLEHMMSPAPSGRAH